MNGEWLQKLLDEHDIKRYKLSKDTGIPQNTIGDYLSGKVKNITLENALIISHYFNKTLSEALGESVEIKEMFPDYVNEVAAIAKKLPEKTLNIFKMLMIDYLEFHDKPKKRVSTIR